ncbi:carbohydrate kinase family protein [Nocardiopsis lambiniae]|uniref:Carbohydrate kinase PfkB domain-containing protein n=1 Tax=Nocardiopsis lambiniae TaxID=3075539 RepID=A0ABU2MDB8_9ACTN|nr:hypothetical protein [Nocardiopsis sp. DSM 44743]MDT0330567.1 hypothetical protein [Nocardiopsis sp. DSM 44743]
MTGSRDDVVVVGGTGVDTLVRVPDLAVPEGDSAQVPPVRGHVGHTGNGVAPGLRHLGPATGFVDFLGDDVQGRVVLDRYAEPGPDFSHVVSPHGTPRGVDLVDDRGGRFSFYDARHPADLRLPREFAPPFLERARHVHRAISRRNAGVLGSRAPRTRVRSGSGSGDSHGAAPWSPRSLSRWEISNRLVRVSGGSRPGTRIRSGGDRQCSARAAP